MQDLSLKHKEIPRDYFPLPCGVQSPCFFLFVCQSGGQNPLNYIFVCILALFGLYSGSSAQRFSFLILWFSSAHVAWFHFIPRGLCLAVFYIFWHLSYIIFASLKNSLTWASCKGTKSVIVLEVIFKILLLAFWWIWQFFPSLEKTQCFYVRWL
jgi:hypothetical protein